MLFGVLLLTTVLYVMARWNSSGPVALSVCFSRYDGTNSTRPVIKLKNIGRGKLRLSNDVGNQCAYWLSDEWATNRYFARVKQSEGLESIGPILEPGAEIEVEAVVACFMHESKCRFEIRYRATVIVDRLPRWLSRFLFSRRHSFRRELAERILIGPWPPTMEIWSDEIRVGAWPYRPREEKNEQ